MKKVDGFTLVWSLMMAFTCSLVAVLSLPELSLLINTEHKGFLGGVCVVVIVITIVMAPISIVTAGGLSAYNTIVDANEEKEEV
jgi:hypothetical protein